MRTPAWLPSGVAARTEPATRGCSSEATMWVSVIVRAIQDLVWFWGIPNEEDQRIHDEACAWLFNPEEEHDFDLVCTFAGLEPGYVRGIAKTALRRRIQDKVGLLGRGFRGSTISDEIPDFLIPEVLK